MHLKSLHSVFHRTGQYDVKIFLEKHFKIYPINFVGPKSFPNNIVYHPDPSLTRAMYNETWCN